ncbi:MAG: hypothetical protein HZB77_07320 [Chloroflexi bacterium]|nr:hypothetical protein [Chloroflexota bacterium]
MWVIPPAAILIGALFFVFYMRNARMKVAAAPTAASPENEGDDYAKKLEKELAKRR